MAVSFNPSRCTAPHTGVGTAGLGFADAFDPAAAP